MAEITAPMPTQTQYQYTGNNDPNNTSDCHRPPSSSLPLVIQNTGHQNLVEKLEFKVRRCRAVWTGRILVDNNHCSFYTPKLFSSSQKCQGSVTGRFNNFIGLGLFRMGSSYCTHTHTDTHSQKKNPRYFKVLDFSKLFKLQMRLETEIYFTEFSHT